MRPARRCQRGHHKETAPGRGRLELPVGLLTVAPRERDVYQRLRRPVVPDAWESRTRHRSIVVHLTGGLSMGPSRDLDTAKADFKAAWEALKTRTSPEDLAAAYRAMNIRDDG